MICHEGRLPDLHLYARCKILCLSSTIGVNLIKIITQSDTACIFILVNRNGLSIFSIISEISPMFVEHVTMLARLKINNSLSIIKSPCVKSPVNRCQNAIIATKGNKGFKSPKLNFRICHPNRN